jgi:hypothetical protein
LDSNVTPPSDRKFGLLFVVVFLVLATMAFMRHSRLHLLFEALAGVTLLFAMLSPRWLAPANRLWMRFGLLLGKIISPIVLGVLFFVVFTPIGLLMRMFGRDILGRSFDKSATSYWVIRSPPGPDGESLREQG